MLGSWGRSRFAACTAAGGAGEREGRVGEREGRERRERREDSGVRGERGAREKERERERECLLGSRGGIGGRIWLILLHVETRCIHSHLFGVWGQCVCFRPISGNLSQDQNLAWTVFHEPYSPDSGTPEVTTSTRICW